MNCKAIFLVLLIFQIACSQGKNNLEPVYVCPPCNLPCDTLTFNAAGKCPHCKMELVKKRELTPEHPLNLNEVKIQNGSGTFLVEGGVKKEKSLLIHYYKPESFTATSPVILVIPGAGRNGNQYRDAWIKKAEKYGVLVLSPEYSEKYYPEFWSYNLAGMITDVKLNKERTAITDFTINTAPETWIFNDFDRIFNLVKNELKLKRDSYDLFGHSAGGQILHRLAIFKPKTKADRILASNSGWYTLPTDTENFPVGLKGSKVSIEDVDFGTTLVIFLGEEDNANETRGELTRSPEIDKQGLHRLERGKFFYGLAKEKATKRNVRFNWKLEVIPNVGHDYRKMSEAAADFLYDARE